MLLGVLEVLSAISSTLLPQTTQNASPHLTLTDTSVSTNEHHLLGQKVLALKKIQILLEGVNIVLRTDQFIEFFPV